MNMNYVDVLEKSSAQNGAIEYLVEASAEAVTSPTTQLNNMNANAGQWILLISAAS